MSTYTDHSLTGFSFFSLRESGDIVRSIPIYKAENDLLIVKSGGRLAKPRESPHQRHEKIFVSKDASATLPIYNEQGVYYIPYGFIQRHQDRSTLQIKYCSHVFADQVVLYLPVTAGKRVEILEPAVHVKHIGKTFVVLNMNSQFEITIHNITFYVSCKQEENRNVIVPHAIKIE